MYALPASSSVTASSLACSALACVQRERQRCPRPRFSRFTRLAFAMSAYLLQLVHQCHCICHDLRIRCVKALREYLIDDPVVACRMALDMAIAIGRRAREQGSTNTSMRLWACERGAGYNGWRICRG